jgi:CHAT domain-containing protein/tetratricopeptide (TPR) repeat protein
MSVRDRVAIYAEQQSRHRALLFMTCTIWLLVLAGCAREPRDALVQVYDTGLQLGGDTPRSLTQLLVPGTYLVELREAGIDVHMMLEQGGARRDFEDHVPRHGVHFSVVDLKTSADLRIVISSTDHRQRRGSVRLLIARWKDAATPAVEELRRGYEAFARAGEQTAAGTPESWTDAAESLRKASGHFAAADDATAHAQAEYALGSLEYTQRSQWHAAIRAAEAAADEYSSLDDETGRQRAGVLRASAEIEVANELSEVTEHAQRTALLESADRRLTEAASYFAAHDEALDAANAVNLRGVRALSAGDEEQALALFSSARDQAAASADPGLSIKALNNLAWLSNRRGEVARAAREYEALLPLLEGDRDGDAYATAIGNYGLCLVALGEFDRALAMHSEALEVFRARGAEADRGRELNAIGGLYMRVGELERAMETLRAASAVNGGVGAASARASSLRMAGNTAAAMGDPRLALRYLQESLEHDATPQNVASTRVLMASQLRAQGDLAGAAREIDAALVVDNDLTRAHALAERAQLRRRQRNYRAALADLHTADKLYGSLGLDFDRIDTNTSLSQTLLAMNDARGATAAADTAIAIEQRIRVKSANPEWRARFLAERYSPYEARIAADLSGSPTREAMWNALRTSEAVRARSLTEQLANRVSTRAVADDPAGDALRAQLTALQLRLESRMQLASADPAETAQLQRAVEEARVRIDAHWLTQRPAQTGHANVAELDPALSAAQAEIPADSAVLAYFVGNEASYAWLLTRAELRHARLAGRGTLQRNADAIVAAQRDASRGAATGDDEASRALLASLLTGVRESRLLVIADGPLNGVPFAALRADPDGPQILERFVVGYAPSLTLALHAPRSPAAPHRRVAVISDPVYARDDSRLRLATAADDSAFRGEDRLPSRRFTRLPYSAVEARAVTRALGADRTLELSGFDATPARVLDLTAEPLAVLHFATHAIARRDSPQQSALYLSQYSADGAPAGQSSLSADEIWRSGLHADLVVLSGCATGDGSAVRGEGVLGLTYAFLANGSRTVVASLWPIQDASTARLMNEFYNAYRASGNAADALRHAQLRVRNGVAWSSFVVRANAFP